MSKFSFSKWVIAPLALFMSLSVFANNGVKKLMEGPNYWVFPGGNYWNWRYSELDQINNKNAGDLVAAWMFSTGRLQGYEGGPLVVLPSSETGLASAFWKEAAVVRGDIGDIVCPLDDCPPRPCCCPSCPLPCPIVYKPEQVLTSEVGFSTTFMDGGVWADLGAFR